MHSAVYTRRHTHLQDGKQPLHYAAAKGAPFEVMKLLLDANRQAAAAADKARAALHIQYIYTPPTPPPQVAVPFFSLSLLDRPLSPRPTMLRRAPLTQGKKLPLHYAAAIGASFEVTELLLEANLEALIAADKARS